MSDAKVFEGVFIKEEPNEEFMDKRTVSQESEILIEICFEEQTKPEPCYLEGQDQKSKEPNVNLDPKVKQKLFESPIGSDQFQFILPDIEKSKLENQSLLKKFKKRNECYICYKKFTFPVALRRHIDIHNGTKLFQCDICDKKFARKTDVIGHLRTHNGDKPYSCHICGKTFANLSNRKRHIDSHTNAKALNCNVCGKTIKCSLKAHLRTHDTEKPFKCHICDKQFTMKNNLNFHVRLHSGEKPFACEICKKNFAEKFTLKRHMAVHSNEKPYPCGICNKKFRTKYALSRHLHVHEYKPKHRKAVKIAQINIETKKIPNVSQSGIVKRKHLNVDIPTKSQNGFNKIRLLEVRAQNSTSNVKSVNQERKEIQTKINLYDAHDVKEELVIGPEVMQY